MKLKKLLKLKKLRGLSPVIAQMLLIGLVITASAITFATVIIAVTTKDPISITIREANDFRLIDTDLNSTKFNSFTILVENSGTRHIGILNSSISVLDSSNNLLSSWVMESNQEIQAKLSKLIHLRTANEAEWLSLSDSITIQAPIFALDAAFEVADKLTVSKSVFITKELTLPGPLQFETNRTSIDNNIAINISDLNNNSLELSVKNYGALDINYTIEFVVSNRSLDLSVTYVGSTVLLGNNIQGSLPGTEDEDPTSSPQEETLVITITNKIAINPGEDEFYIIVWLKVKSKIFDTLFIICKT